MYNKSDLENLTILQLKEIAQSLSIPIVKLSTQEDLINAILTQQTPTGGSQFFSREESEETNKSQIINPETQSGGSDMCRIA